MTFEEIYDYTYEFADCLLPLVVYVALLESFAEYLEAQKNKQP